MVGYIRGHFCDEARYSPKFGPISSSVPWIEQYRAAKRIDPEPTDLKAIRKVHPDIRHPGMPDLIAIGISAVVSEAFRQLILELEPNKHQFLPIALHDEARRPLPGTYWMLNALQRPECVIKPDQISKWDAEGRSLPELEGHWVSNAVRTGLSFRKKPANVDLSRPDLRRPTQKVVYLDRSRIEGLHLWRRHWHISIYHDVKFDLFMSDELLLRIRRARLRKLTVHPVVEMSVPTGG
jgi:Immunity protein family (Imm11)